MNHRLGAFSILDLLLPLVSLLIALGLGSDERHYHPSRDTVSSHAGPGVFSLGEDLIYNVRYLFWNIGQIRIRVTEKLDDSGYSKYRAVAFIDSYPGVPFVNLHSIMESFVDQDFYSRGFLSRDRTDEGWMYVKYAFEDSAHAVIIEKGELPSNTVSFLDTVVLKRYPYQDGFSLVFYARSRIGSGARVNVPTLIDKDTVSTSIYFHQVRAKIKIDAVDYPIDAVQLQGTAQFVGIYGLTGEFRGFFTNDEARIPILAFMRVFVGNVKIELKEWKRTGWVPPRFPTGRTK